MRGKMIGFAGKAGAGKDTAAGFLVEAGFARVAFADPMKRMVRDVFDFSREQLWGPSTMRNAPDLRYPREHGPMGNSPDAECPCCGAGRLTADFGKPCYLTPRFALQTLGTEWGRSCYGHVWIDKGLAVAEAILARGLAYDPEIGLVDLGGPRRGVVFTDVRFANEAARLREKGVHVCRIDRPESGLSGAAGKHASEAEISGLAVDSTIANDLGLGEFRAQVERVRNLLSAGSSGA